MQNPDWERSLQKKTDFVIAEYRQIVEAFFPAGVPLTEFIDIFSGLNFQYQDTNNRKMDPDSIREMKISCSSAAALLGIWWAEQFPQLTPIFLIENTSRTGNPTTSAHVNVAVPQAKEITSYEALAAFHSSQRSQPNVEIIDWTLHSQMKGSNPQKIYDVYPVTGVHEYVKNRIRVLGLPKKYSSVKGALAGK